MPSAEISRQLGNISARMVSYRIESLIERGIIDIRAVVNPVKLGYKVLADVLIEIEPGLVQTVARQLVSFPHITYVACATGDRDVSIQVVAEDNESLFQFVTEVLGNITGVRRTQTHLLPLKFKDMDVWLPPELEIGDDSD